MRLLLEQDLPGAYQAVGPWPEVTLGQLVAACGAQDLVEVAQQPSFPLVLADPSYDVMFRRSAAAAHAVGMPATPLEQTVRDVRAWDLARGLPDLVEGWTAEQEADALANSVPG